MDFTLLENESQFTRTANKLKTATTDFSRSNSTVKRQFANNLKIFENVSGNITDQYTYCTVASRVKSVIDFVKVAYPDMIGGDGVGKGEPLNNKDRKVCRAKLLSCVERGFHTVNTVQEIVYDLDALAYSISQDTRMSGDERFLGNLDEERVGKRHPLDTKQLQFESRFESGNLRRAIQVYLGSEIIRPILIILIQKFLYN